MGNIVNATILAKDAGLVTNARDVKTSILKEKGLDKLLQLTVKRGPTILELVGSVQSGNSILFAINNSWFPFGATLSGNVLLFSGKRPDSTLSTIETFVNPEKLNATEAAFVAQLAF